MSDDADAAKSQEAHEADKEINVMQDRPDEALASFSEGRNKQVSAPVIPPSSPVNQPRSARSAREPKDTGAPSVAAKGRDTGSKPFSMSYGGMTQAEYLQQLLKRGCR